MQNVKITKEIKDLCVRVWKNVNKWVQDNEIIDPETMCGACAIVSYTLFLILKQKGHRPTFVLARNGCESHCWIEWKGFVFDLSCKQFSDALPDSLIIKKIKYKKEIPQLKKYNEIIKNQIAIDIINNTWNEQNPIKYKSKINSLIRRVAA